MADEIERGQRSEELRTPYLTQAEVDRLIEAAKGNS